MTVNTVVGETSRGNCSRRRRRSHASNTTDYVIGAPADSAKFSERRNRDRAVAALYEELAEELSIEILASVRGHVWRATLNSLLLNVPEAQRAAFFGHGPAANRPHYTDVTSMIRASKRLRDPSGS